MAFGFVFFFKSIRDNSRKKSIVLYIINGVFVSASFPYAATEIVHDVLQKNILRMENLRLFLSREDVNLSIC